MRVKRLLSCLLTTAVLVSSLAVVPQTVLAGTETVSQTVYEMDIDGLKSGTVPSGITLNTDILDESASSSSAGLISDVLSSQTAFLTIDLKEASKNLSGQGTGIYTIEVVLNQNDSDSDTLNGTIMSMTGTAKKDVWRVRESADIAVLNSWSSTSSLFSTGSKSSETASYVFTDLNVNTGAMVSHAAKYGTNPVYNGYANGQAVSSGNASSENPINIIEFRTATTSSGGGMRANIKSLKITRKAEVSAEAEKFEFSVSSDDNTKGTVTVTGLDSDGKATKDSEVKMTAVPNENYIFTGWYKDGSDTAIDGAGATYTVTASDETSGSYTAKFQKASKVDQSVFELNIDALKSGTVPTGVTFNSSILNESASSSSAGLISNVVSADTAFLTVDLKVASENLSGQGTGLYTIELITNLNDSDDSTKNGTIMNIAGTSDMMVFRARENSDFCVMPNSWTSLHWKTDTGATASYGIKNLNIYDGSAEAHYAKRDSSNQYDAYANGHVLSAGNASKDNPINTITIKAAKDRRANIKSFRIVRTALIPSATYTVGAESYDSDTGSISISKTTVESGESVTLTATPKENYIFEGWYDKDTDTLIPDAESVWTFYPTESKNYVAKFVYATTYKITVKSADEEKGTVSVSKKAPYYENDEISISASAKTGYIFNGWYKTGTPDKISSDSAYTISVSAATEGEYVAKFVTAAFSDQQVYKFDFEKILNDKTSLPDGITLNDSVLDADNSSADGGFKSVVGSSAQTLITIDFETLVNSLNLSGMNSGIYSVELAVNVKDDEDAVNGTDLYAVTSGGTKQLLSASESAGVKATNGSGMNGGGDSYKRTYVTYSFDINVSDGNVTSTLTDQTGSSIFSSVANGQTVTLPGVSESNPVTKLEIKNIANQRVNIKSLNILRKVAVVDYGNDTPVFNETCVSFVDGNGDKLTGNKVTAAIKQIKIDFKSILRESTVNKNSVYLEKDGTKLDIEPIHCDGIVTLDVNGLLPDSTYKVYVTGSVKNTSGIPVRNADVYTFNTKPGECSAKITGIKTGGSEISSVSDLSKGCKLDAEVKFFNTFDSRNLYIVYTAYRNNEIADIKIAEYNSGYTVSDELIPGFTVGDMTGITAVNVFVLDEWNLKNILDEKVIGTALTYKKSDINDTDANVSNSENKVVVTGIADSDDKILIEFVKGNIAHKNVFEGLSKTDNIYAENLPISFFATLSGSFSVDVPLTESGDYTVYVKNLTDGEMLIDGKVITFTDSETYKNLVNGLDKSDSDSFAASLTDDTVKKLGFNIALNTHLSSNEINAVKTNIFTEGLSETDDKANRKMYSEYAVMEFVNNNATVTAEVAADVVDALTDTISADKTLKTWFDKYIVTAQDKTEFVGKLLAAEPLTAGAEKIASREKLSDAVKVALVLKIAKAPNGYTNIGKVFSDFKSAFGRTTVSSSNDIYSKMIGDYANKSAFLKKYDNEVSKGGGGGGGISAGNSKLPVSSSDDFSIDFVNGSMSDPSVSENSPTPMNKNIFTDIDSVSWAKEAIVTLKEKNVISGKTETEFFPNDNITREEFTKLIASAFAGDEEKCELTFSDVNPDEWYYPYIQQAKSAGLVSGMSESYFGIGQNITRQDMAVMIFNAVKYKNLAGNSEPEDFPFADDRDISDYAKESVYTLKTMGIINGIDADNFAPLATATRAEAAVMIYRLLLK